ncbi:hypothetical protein IG631_14116 [Alternaria alternata]|nr:hypothetical protein IG631_14116 [Alternaria alternata]
MVQDGAYDTHKALYRICGPWADTSYAAYDLAGVRSMSQFYRLRNCPQNPSCCHSGHLATGRSPNAVHHLENIDSSFHR